MKSQEILEMKSFKKDDSCGIYKIINLVNKKVYIGSSKNIIYRFKYGHIYELENNKHKNIYLQRSWNKYGDKNFQFEIIEICSEDLLLEKEQHHLDLYGGCNSKENYNNKEPERLSVSEETKHKMSEARMGIKNHWFGVPKSEEFKKFLSDSRKGVTWEEKYGKNKSDELKKKQKQIKGKKHPLYGTHRSDDTKNKISEARMGITFEERFGQKESEKMKENLSNHNKGYKNNSAKINEEIARDIKIILDMKLKYNLKISHKMIASMFNVNKTTIDNISACKTWKYIKI